MKSYLVLLSILVIRWRAKDWWRCFQMVHYSKKMNSLIILSLSMMWVPRISKHISKACWPRNKLDKRTKGPFFRQKNKRTKCLDDKYVFLLETLRASSPVSNNHTYLCFKKQSSSTNCYHQSTPPPLPVPRPLRGGEPNELAVVINSPPIVGEGWAQRGVG